VARYLDVHPVNPQPRLIEQAVATLRDDGVIAYPTDSGYALGIQLGNRTGLDRMRSIRQLDDKHHFTLVCHDFAQLGPLVHIDNAVFRTVKAATPGSYTFILPATSEVPRRLMHPKKRSVGVRIPDHVLVQALLAALGEPLISTTLLLPGQSEPMTEGWQVQDEIGQLVDAVIEGEAGSLPTTVVDLTSGEAEIVRYGAGDASRFE
jgi:tRNA threonylcarbamoyl adenosine modification protein (Sua5/YciO/YrdC/YwlC family)